MIPTNVDCVIVGTGLTNSILAAACSRIGKTVLHLDKNSYYGEEWASFTFQQLMDWIKLNHPDNESLVNVPEDLLSKSRMFCIDLCPRLLYSNGSMVDLLVKSNVSRYHEFKNNIRILSMVDGELHVMPCRRSDVFNSPLLSNLVDKRKLMKFIELCIKYEPTDGDESSEDDISKNANKPIVDFLQEKGLNKTLREYIINSIAMLDPNDSTLEACKRIKNFMVAIERFGRSPFLFPLYGCGEFPQSFCRLSAVFGGVYCLNTEIDNIKINETFSVVLPTKSEVSCDNLILDYSSAKSLNITSAPLIREKLSRAILITQKSLVDNPENLVSFLRIPTSDKNKNIVYLLELNSSSLVCPPGLNILYLWTKSTSNCSKKDLNPIIESLFKDAERDVKLWSFYFQQLSEPRNRLLDDGLIPKLHITGPPCNDIDYESSIQEAEKIFKQMCPDEEFLPRAPDPEEIITE